MEFEFLDELPPVATKPAPVERNRQGDIVYLRPGEGIVCECGASEVDRVKDTYKVKGKMYHREGWLTCVECGDKVNTNVKLEFVECAWGGSSREGDKS